MIREYTPEDREFVLEQVICLQKKIKMVSMPFLGKSMKNKRRICEKFLKTIIKPENKCYIFLNQDGRKIGFSCFRPTTNNNCFLEFFVKDNSVNMTGGLMKKFRNHIETVRIQNGYDKMFAQVVKRNEYERWFDMSKRYFNAKEINTESKLYKLIQF